MIKAALLAALASAAFAAAAAEKAPDAAHVKSVIADHRTIADAHAAAAKCLDSGRAEKECHADLAKACRDVAIGKYCGMRQHRH